MFAFSQSRVSSLLVTRVSSHKIVSASKRASKLLLEISPKLPIGVGTKVSKTYERLKRLLNFSEPVKNG